MGEVPLPEVYFFSSCAGDENVCRIRATVSVCVDNLVFEALLITFTVSGTLKFTIFISCRQRSTFGEIGATLYLSKLSKVPSK